jgi:hypothetical protein
MPLQRIYATFDAEGYNRIAIILDASDVAREHQADITALVKGVLFRLPASVERKLYFLGNPEAYPVHRFDMRAAQWFQENWQRASLVTPILETFGADDKMMLVIVGSGPVFDLEDWIATPFQKRMLLVNMGRPLQGRRRTLEEVTRPTDEDLCHQVYDPVEGVEVSGRGFMPTWWDNDGYQLEVGRETRLVARGLADYSVSVECFVTEPEELRAIVTRASGAQIDELLEQVDEPLFDEAIDGQLTPDEAAIFRSASQQQSFTCLHCDRQHPWNQLYCRARGRIIGTSIYPSLQALKPTGFVLFRDEKTHVRFRIHSGGVLLLPSGDVAVKGGSRASIYRFNGNTEQWIQTKEALSLYHCLGGDEYAVFL